MDEKSIYKAFIEAGMSPEGACGLLGNLQAESSLRANNAQDGMTKLTDEEYTAAADRETIDFVYDSVGYGIAQWTFWSRKQKLMDFAKSRGVSVGDSRMQVDFCVHELRNDYKAVWDKLCSRNLYEATACVCTQYEKPAVNNIETRYQHAQRFFTALAAGEVPKDEGEKEETEGAKMTVDQAIERLIACARAEVGYLEKRSNSQLDDKTANAGNRDWNKYARDIDEKYPNFYNGKKNGFSWCDIFVDWCFISAFGYDKALKLLCAGERSTGAGCKYSAGFYRSKGQFYNSPKVGDQVFFGDHGNEGHTGIVIKVEGDYITTVEGNTTPGTGVVSNGDGVYEKRYNIRQAYIPGYGRPDYSIVANAALPEEPEKNEDKDAESDTLCTVTLPVVKWGDIGGSVAAAQALLIKRGYSVGICGTDGEFGPDTLAAVKRFQVRKAIAADGIVGSDTWSRLIRG